MAIEGLLDVGNVLRLSNAPDGNLLSQMGLHGVAAASIAACGSDDGDVDDEMVDFING